MVFKHLIYVCHRCGMHFERFYSLNHSVLGSFPHLHHLGFQPALSNLGKLCAGNGMSVLPYPHPQLFKVFKHLMYVCHGCGMHFERFYSLNHSVVGSFPHLLLPRGESLNNKPQLTKTCSYSDKLILYNHHFFIGQSQPNRSTSARIFLVKFLPPLRLRSPSFGHRDVPLRGGLYL